MGVRVPLQLEELEGLLPGGDVLGVVIIITIIRTNMVVKQ